jgi:16S rRNA (uracil1498-N3)-methyltransferase
LILYEGNASCRLRDALNDLPVSSAALIVGPEGGFEASEIHRVARAGIVPVTLGSRILRTETAAIAGVALAQFFMDEFG